MVASLATITHSRPDTRPMPVMIEAECTSPEYMPQAASCPTSRNGDPGSRSVRTRSRGRSLPRASCFLRAASSPPFETREIFSRKSETSCCICSEFALNSAPRSLSWLLRITTSSPSFQATADDHALDVARPLVDLRNPHVPPQALD